MTQSKEVAKTQTNEIVEGQASVMSNSFDSFMGNTDLQKEAFNMIDGLREAVEVNGINLAMSYWELSLGKEYRCVFLGINPYTFVSPNTGLIETKDAAYLGVEGEEGKEIKILAASKFVGACKNLPPSISLKFKWYGSKPSNGKQIRQFDIKQIANVKK